MNKDDIKKIIGQMIIDREISFELAYDNYDSYLELVVEVTVPTDDGYTEEVRFIADGITIK